MIYKNEKHLLSIIRYALPLLALILSIGISTFLYFENKSQYEKIKKNTEKEFVLQQKELVKSQIEDLYKYIITEQKETKDNLKKSLKEKTYEAHKIISNIYNEYKNTHTKEEITRKIKTAIRPIRFNNNRGYFFIGDNKKTNVLHPLLPELEGTDISAVYKNRKDPIKELKNKNEFFDEWYWRKSKNDLKQYRKLGFIKHISQMDWYIGTGEYIDDFEKDIQEKVLSQIKKFRFGKSGYFYIFDKNNITISHKNEKLLGHNIVKEDLIIGAKEIVAKMKTSEGFTRYTHRANVISNKAEEKIVYSKIIPNWNWVIATGFYINDVKETIEKRHQALENEYLRNIKNLLFMSGLLTLILFTLSFFISKLINTKFIEYKMEVEDKNDELLELNNNLEKKVESRTIELKRTNEELEDSNEELQTMIHNFKLSQEQLVKSEKMANLGKLVAGVAHEINTPIGLGLTASSHFSFISEIIKEQYENEEMSKEEFEKFLEESHELSSLIFSNLTRTSEIIKSFKQVAIDQTSEQAREFNLKDYTKGVIYSMSNLTKKKNIDISIECDEKLNIHSFPGLYSQIITNLIINSIRHGFKLKESGNISIHIEKVNDTINVKYKDDGKGIKKDNLEHIFEPFFTTNREDGGTGLGLNIIYNIITNNLKGTISCESEENKGVEFIISFKIGNI